LKQVFGEEFVTC